ncbi:hypothetical protein LCGC14_0302590 [marine sediment metagenome]|uniref:Uncharacterized protein n=1 Tax=marine sediment metagenome TaxID=412755 RepID=A0A0F9U6Q6_9ZZZZ
MPKTVRDLVISFTSIAAIYGAAMNALASTQEACNDTNCDIRIAFGPIMVFILIGILGAFVYMGTDVTAAIMGYVSLFLGLSYEWMVRSPGWRQLIRDEKYGDVLMTTNFSDSLIWASIIWFGIWFFPTWIMDKENFR